VIDLQGSLYGAAAVGGTHDLLTPATGLMLTDGVRTHVVDLKSGTRTRTLAAWLKRGDRVVAFDHARPHLRRLLAAGLDVPRVLCRRTLLRIQGEKTGDESPGPFFQDAAKERARAALNGLDELLSGIANADLGDVARLECQVLRPFAAMEHRGLPLDEKAWRHLVAEAEKEAQKHRNTVMVALGDLVQRDLFGEADLNLDSDQDVKAILEKKLGRALPNVGRATLRELGDEAGLALIEYREAHKIVTTYGKAFLEHVHPRTGRVHAHFEPVGASTGRVSCRDPNLQNLPGDNRFHFCVRPGDGRVLVTADYSGCELRVLAALSGDATFIDAFANDRDLHSEVASRMFGEEVSKEKNEHLRQRAKAINFGLIYGMGKEALARQVGVSVVEADDLLTRYFQTYPGIKAHLDRSVDLALERGYAQTALGRKLQFSPEQVASPNARGELSRIAKNMPIQGTSADIAKLAMVRLHDRLEKADIDGGLVNMIHDELVVECPADQAEVVADLTRSEMADALQTILPEVKAGVDVHVGPHWEH
jgi:DNA polymerase-1